MDCKVCDRKTLKKNKKTYGFKKEKKPYGLRSKVLTPDRGGFNLTKRNWNYKEIVKKCKPLTIFFHVKQSSRNKNGCRLSSKRLIVWFDLKTTLT